MDSKKTVEELKDIARQLRIDILKMLNLSGSGHSGGSLSCIDILVAIYYTQMNHSPSHTATEKRDKFVLSKGHAAPALYAILAKLGYFDAAELSTLRKNGSMLSGHPYAPYTAGVEVTTGSLGQGLSQANGLALAARLDGWDSHIYCLMGDGEIQEGQVWEAAMTAAHYKLDNVIGIVDNNGLQIDGFVEDVMGVEPIGDKWAAFGWHVIEVDGHDIEAVCNALTEAKSIKGKPKLIHARTVKGKGVSFMENLAKWHGAVPSDEDLKAALIELGDRGGDC